MKYIAMMLLVLVSPSALLAAEKPSQPLPPITMEQLLQEIRDMDSSLDTEGDHVVGEHLC
jgi:hypothetical protein